MRMVRTMRLRPLAAVLACAVGLPTPAGAQKPLRGVPWNGMRGVPAGKPPAVAASTGPDKRPDDIDAVAKPSTVIMQCFR